MYIVIENLLFFMLIVSGVASQYAPGKMQSVIWVRQNRPVAKKLWQELPPTDGYIAVQDCDEIGNVWWLRPKDRGWDHWESFLVVDCSGSSETTSWMIANNILVELDYQTARRWGTVGRGIKIERFVGWHLFTKEEYHPR